ncbi:hypothetical protein D3C81_1445130 [compost metagenome]
MEMISPRKLTNGTIPLNNAVAGYLFNGLGENTKAVSNSSSASQVDLLLIAIYFCIRRRYGWRMRFSL